MPFTSTGHRSGNRVVEMVLVLAGLLALPACWVKSIHGLREGGLFGLDKDQTFDASLLGTWKATVDECSITLGITADRKEYHWKTTSVGKECDNDRGDKAYYDAELFKLDDHEFLDLTARSEDVCKLCVAIHWIFLVQIEKGSLSLTPIDSDWLEKAEEQRIIALATLPGDTGTITASPAELKAFCRKYADDKAVFKPPPTITFRKSAGG